MSHNYKAGSYSIELYEIGDYSIIGDGTNNTSLISHPSSVKRVVLGSNVVSIEDEAFGGCSSLTSVYIPESVTSIGFGAFSICTSLTSINIPNSVVSIGVYAFILCSSLTSVIIPNSVTSIGEGAFANCSGLTSVVLPSSATISSNAFVEAGLPIIDGVIYSRGDVSGLTVGNYTLDGIGLLTFYLNGNSYSPDNRVEVFRCDTSRSGDLIIPSTIGYNGVTYNVTSIGNYTFYGCSSLTSINIPESVTSIGNSTFTDCRSLSSISSLNPTAPTLFGSVTNIPANGTLHIKSGATGYDVWLSKLPEGWTIVEDL